MEIRVRLASVSLLMYLGAIAGCGDDITPQSQGTGGSTGGSMGGSNAGAGGGGNGGGGSGGGGTGGSIGGSGGGGSGGGGTGGAVGGKGGGGSGGGGSGGGGTGGAVGGKGGGGSGGGGTGGGGTGGAVGGKGGGGTGGGGTGGGGTGGGGTGGGGTGGGGTGGGGTGGGGTGGGGTGGGGTGGGGTGGGGTGGGGTGGGGTGGGGTGGGGTGGGGTSGTGGAPPCYTVAFTKPTNGASLTVADDNNMNCGDGFQYTVAITTNAPDGTMVQLFNNGNTLLSTATVASGAASFAVQLASSGQSALSIQFPSTAMCTDPSTQSTVTVNCPNTPPTCNISQPTISGTHPALNGVLAPAGDRASQIGSPYQVTFTVTTNAEDGQPVAITFNNAASPGVTTTLNGTASGGSATFGLALSPDGTYQVSATCKNLAGITGNSPQTSFPVDTTPPDLTVTQPADGQFFGPTDLDGQGRFNVCGRTSATDAVNLPASLGPAVNNLCVALGGSASCVGTAPVTAVNTDACVPVTCPGAAPFNITVTIKDAAGNPTSSTVQGVSCASMLPSVQVIAPVSDAPAFNDPSKHILAANAPVGVRDQDPTTPGAQTDVVACTDRAGSAALFVGFSGGTLNQLGSPITAVAAVPADNCPAGLGFVARFSGVTLPNSIENTNGSIAIPTELRVKVTDPVNSANIGTSVPVDVWVDTVAPTLTLRTPANLCGSFTQSSTTITQDVAFNAETSAVTLQVANGASTEIRLVPTSFAAGVATFNAVDFDPGQNDLTATESDPAGNQTTLVPAPCTVIIGSAPVVTFTAPTAGQVLCPSGSSTPGCDQDNDTTMPGWQGTISVHVTTNGNPVTTGTVTFTVGNATLGGAPVAIDGSGNATLNGISLPEGPHTIIATTSNIPNAGVGTGSVTITVDMTAPDAPTGLTATIADRRKTSIQLSWTAPGDSGANVAGYDIRYAKTQITDNASFNAATAVTYTGNPPAPGQPDGILVDNLYIENGYFFAVKSRDSAGNLSPFQGTTTAVTAHFNRTAFVSGSSANEALGFSISAEDDVNGDGLSDILVGTALAGKAYLFLGSASVAPAAPSVTFTGAATSFGLAVAQIGDIDNDTRPDIAIADPTNRVVYIYKGRASWPATLTDAAADYTITGTAPLYMNSNFGSSISRLGDFTGDGIDDFAIGARGFMGNIGRVVIIPGKAAGFASVTLPDVTNSIVIDGDASLGTGFFGYRVLGIGHYYSTTTGTTLITSAPGRAAAGVGAVYAFHGQTGTAGVIAIATADAVLMGAASTHPGSVLTSLGPLLGSLPAVGTGNPADNITGPGANGTGFITFGPQSTGPFTSRTILTLPGTTQAGGFIIGGGLPGQDVSVSLIGDATPDVVFGPKAGSSYTILDGSLLGSKTSPVNAATSAEVVAPLSLTSGEAESSLLKDFNGDGRPDFCIGTGVGATPGSIVVFW